MSQEARVLNHLKRFGGITPMAALRSLRRFPTGSPDRAIAGTGPPISTEMVRGPRQSVRQVSAGNRRPETTNPNEGANCLTTGRLAIILRLRALKIWEL